MRFDRRSFLGLAAASGGAALVAGCSPAMRRLAGEPLPQEIIVPANGIDATVRLMNRVGFGPRPGDLERIKEVGRERYVEDQLNPSAEDELSHQLLIRNLDISQMDTAEQFELRKEAVVEQLQQAALLRMVYSRYVLRERMADFWSNHFNIYALKGDGAFGLSTDDAAVIRKNALGKFPDLLRASAHSPAMLAYLDNQVNRKGVANENYARELMELHSLGVHGGYTQRDVQEVARCFTGWTVENRFLHSRGRFRFNESLHDDGEKSVLGHPISAGGGQLDGERVLDILAAHPSTANHLAAKLGRHFLGEAGGDWTAKLAAVYLRTGGDIRAMMRPLLLSKELMNGPLVAKRPLDYLVSSLRALGSETDCGFPLQVHLEKMGQGLHGWPMPDGYPDRTSAWTGSLLARWNFALSLVGGEIRGTACDPAQLAARTGQVDSHQALVRLVCPGADPSPLRAHSIVDAAALCLAGPEFQWR